jgi:hypothetical protein
LPSVNCKLLFQKKVQIEFGHLNFLLYFCWTLFYSLLKLKILWYTLLKENVGILKPLMGM